MPAVRALRDDLDLLLALDPGGRGLARFLTPGAAAAAARALRRARRVLIATGFCVPPGQPETDGPPGAAVLGRALRRLGASVRYVTDAPVREPLAAALGVLGEPADIADFSPGADGARALLDRERPTHLVAIERPGRNRAGLYLSLRGESIAAWNTAIDDLFLAPARTVTIAVGDGGNEIGMGNLRARLERAGRLMARIASTVRVRHLVLAGVSNWGAYAIAAALGRLAGQDLLHTAEDERRLIAACVKAGAVDGITRSPDPSVDGLGLEVHAGFVALLRRAALAPAERRAAIAGAPWEGRPRRTADSGMMRAP